jgi:hypothetical protein
MDIRYKIRGGGEKGCETEPIDVRDGECHGNWMEAIAIVRGGQTRGIFCWVQKCT